MEQLLIEASEVGRDVVASISASVLSSVISELVARFQNAAPSRNATDNVLVRYNEKFQLEIHRERPRKSKDDEGFESDDDNSGTSSMCYMGQDHLFKLQKKMTYDTESDRVLSFANSDSANSSGSSDSDDIEITLPITNQCWIECFPITDVLFCHTEPRFPNTIAWVVKRKSSPFDMASVKLGKTGVEHFSASSSCLNVIVVKCRAYDEFSILCDQYRELSRRIKLDQYKSINRKKPIILTCLTDTSNVKVSLADIKVAPSSLLKASELSISNTNNLVTKSHNDLKKKPVSVSLNSLLKADSISEDNQLLGNGDTLIKSKSLTSIVPKKFNLLQRTDFDGMTHSEVSKMNKSKIQKEIEGVIMSQVDSIISTPVRRQRCTPSILPDAENSYWSLSDLVTLEKPPERPERRKFLRKKATDGNNPLIAPSAAAPAAEPLQLPSTAVPATQSSKSKSKFYLPIHENSGPNSFQQTDTKRISRKCDEYAQAYSDRRRRARSAGRTVTTPMAYRYIDVNFKPLVNSCAVTRRRRNSFDETIQVKLKSVIKTNKKPAQDKYKYNEPKKVTFSAYATVQVVD